MPNTGDSRSWKLTAEQHARCCRAMLDEIARWVAEGGRPPRIALPSRNAEVLSSLDIVQTRIALDESTRTFLGRLVEACKPHGGATIAVLEDVLDRVGIRVERVPIATLGLEPDSLLVSKIEEVVVPPGVSPCQQDMRRRVEYYVKTAVLPRAADDFRKGTFSSRVLLFARRSLATGEVFGGVRALEVASWSSSLSADFMLKVAETARIVNSVATAFASPLNDHDRLPRGVLVAVLYVPEYQAETIPGWHAIAKDGQLQDFVPCRMPREDLHVEATSRLRGVPS